jgi:hypothetical protein
LQSAGAWWTASIITFGVAPPAAAMRTITESPSLQPRETGTVESEEAISITGYLEIAAHDLGRSFIGMESGRLP